MQNIKTEWDLSRFYPSIDSQEQEQDTKQLLILADKFEQNYKGKIAKLDNLQIKKMLKDDEQISVLASKLMIYLNLLTAKDTQNQFYLKEYKKYRQIMIDIQSKLLFYTEEINQLGYDKLIELSNSRELAAYKNYFYQKVQSIKHYLGEKIENILNQKSTSGASAFVDLHEELTGSFKYEVKWQGKNLDLTESDLRGWRLDPNEEKRKLATEVLAQTYHRKETQITLASSYISVVKDWVSDVKIRGYKNIMEPRNIGEEMDNQTVSKLLNVVTKNYSLYHDFLKIKAKKLGKQKLEVWDVFAPVINDKKKLSFEDGLKIYLQSIKQFDRQFYDLSLNLINEGRVDVFPKMGKMGGAFANYSKGLESWVMLNHLEDLDSVSTLAHEFGHAIHGNLSQSQPSQVFSSPLCLAETASIFNEQILADYVMPSLTEEEKEDYIFSILDDLFGTIFRQVMYVSFEKTVHEKIFNGEELSYEDLNRLWLAENTKYYGDAVNIRRELVEANWSAIPHIFHTPFYCYAYAFGAILSLNLFENYREDGADFIPKYKAILASGGSVRPKELLAKYNIDIDSDIFYNKGLNHIKKLLQQISA